MVIQSQQAADAGAVLSASLATVTWLADLGIVMTLAATGTAIWAGSMAALYHYEAWKQKRRDSKK